MSKGDPWVASVGSASQPTKNMLKALHSNPVNFHHSFSMGNALKCGPLIFVLTGEATRHTHTPALNRHDFDICCVRGCNTFLQEPVNNFVCVMGPLFALYSALKSKNSNYNRPLLIFLIFLL